MPLVLLMLLDISQFWDINWREIAVTIFRPSSITIYQHSVNFCSKYEFITLKSSILMSFKRHARENWSLAAVSHLTAGRVSLSSKEQKRLKDYVIQFTKALPNRG